MRRFTLILICLGLLLAALTGCTQPDGDLVLAKNEQALYSIVIASDASEPTRYAAKELKAYLDQITLCDFAIVTDDTAPSGRELCVGKTNREKDAEIDRESLGEEGYLFHENGERIFISGGGDRGTVYGVYGFLEEKFGVRYYAEGVEKIPENANLSLPRILQDEIEKPLFDQRNESLHPSGTLTWLEKQRINMIGSHPDLSGADGITFSAPGSAHTFGPLMGWGETHYKQPCLTDPDTFDTMLKSAREYLAKSPDADILSVSQNDASYTTSGECECENCQDAKARYGSSGVLLDFVNRIAEALKEDYPDLAIETFAYYHTAEPPKGGIRAADNVSVRFCNLPKCLRHSWIEDEGNDNQLYATTSSDNFNYLREWKNYADRLYVWDYASNFGCSFAITPNFDMLYDNITTAYAEGVDGYFMQGMANVGEFTELRAYLCAKLMWNPTMSKEEFNYHLYDFLEGYYGIEAAPYLKDYIEYAAEVTSSTHPSIYWDTIRYLPVSTKTDENGKVVLDTTVLDRMKGYFDDAMATAETTEQFDRIRKSSMPVLYYEIVARLATRDKTGEGLETIRALNQRLFQMTRKYKITRVREGFGIPEAPNFDNAPLYWGNGYSGIYSDATLKAAQEREKQ